MPIPLVVTKRYEGQRVTSWWQPATQTNRDPNRDKKLCGSTSNDTDQYKKKHPEGKNVRRALHTKRKRQWYKKYSEKATSPNKQKEKRNTCGYRGACVSKEDWTKGRGFNERITTKTKQNKTKVTPKKGVMASANQTPGGYKFAPLVASQQGRANQHEPACFGLSSAWSFPSRSGIRLHAV